MQEDQDFRTDGYASVDQPIATDLLDQCADRRLYELYQRTGFLH